MTDRIAAALAKCFEKSRIVFWYDEKEELRDAFETVSIPTVEKMEILNNEFGLKLRMLRQEPAQKFLVYREGPRPENIQNWLLDVELAHLVFRADQSELWRSEMELPTEMAELVENHQAFYKAEKRKEALQSLLHPEDDNNTVRLKMLAICVGAEARIDAISEQLLAELAVGRDEKWRMIERCALDSFLWTQLERGFGYRAGDPSVEDFAIELFKSAYAMGTEGQPSLSPDAHVFLGRWQDSRQHSGAFDILSAKYEDLLSIEADLEARDFRDVMGMDPFRVVDLKVLHGLVDAVTNRTASAGDVALWVRERRQSHWHGEFRHLYAAVDFAAQFNQSLDEFAFEMASLEEGVQRYCESWCQLDRLYRKFVYHVREAKQTTLMGPLVEQVEDLYVNKYLLPVNNRWQELVEAAERWEVDQVVRQDEFFKHHVDRFLRKKKKICVIVSDALRYEIGEQLLTAIRGEDKYSAEIEPMLSTLPSYTQLGMAALLPNQQLELLADSSLVRVDGQPSQKTSDRGKILDGIEQRGAAVRAEAFMDMHKDTRRALCRDHDVVYVYQNRIDAVGDKRDTEQHVFAAAEQAIEELVALVKRLVGANFTNFIVTADHGFIYQDRPIEESEFLAAEVSGTEIGYRDRRFVLGTGLGSQPGLHHFTAEQLGLQGEVEVLVPKSINRLRRQGSGSRYVHGGACLQEVVVPVIRINKREGKSDVSLVEVDIVQGGKSVISTGQLAVMFYQHDPVSEKVHGRKMWAGIYTEAGVLVSDRHELDFQLQSENPREREMRVQFLLTRAADDLNGQEVVLKLEERYRKTNQFTVYKSVRYMVRRQFTSDFD